MHLRHWLYPLAAPLLAAVVLTGCGANPSAQAGASTQEEILPTPVPIPTGVPQPPTATPVPAPSNSSPSVASASSLLKADFGGDTKLSTWSVIDASDLVQSPSKWSVANGRLAQVSDGDDLPSQYATALVTGQPDWKNYSVSVSGYATGNDEMGVVFRETNKSYYVFRLLSGTGDTRVLSRYDADAQTFTDIAKVAGPGYESGRWYQLRVSVQGSKIQAFVDDQLAVEGTDSTLTQGRAGVYGYAEGDLQFDNFAVQALPDSQ